MPIRSVVALLCLVSPSPLPSAQGQLLREVERTLPLDVHSAVDIVSADFSGDGHPDLCVLNDRFSTQEDFLYFNNGYGVFHNSGVEFPVTWKSDAADAADVDGDGDQDLLIGYRFAKNRLFRNDGSGQMVVDAPATPDVPDFTQHVAFGDMDGDGDADIICASWGAPNRLYLNDGSGNFSDASAQLSPALESRLTRCAVLADVDQDGSLDVVFGNTGDPDELLLNDGLGVFTDVSLAQLPDSGLSTTDYDAIDIDGDGDLDLYASSTAGDVLHENNGAGVFADVSHKIPGLSSRDAALGDVDGDGDADLVSSNLEARGLYLNNGSGVFSPGAEVFSAPGESTALFLGDLDQDNDLDVVFGFWAEGQDRLFFNDGAGLFAEEPGSLPVEVDSLEHLALGDVNGDGALDLLVGGGEGPEPLDDLVLLNDGHGNFTAPVQPLLTGSSMTVALADLDDDGDLDALALGGDDRLSLNDGSGVFTRAPFPGDGELTGSVTAGDVDGDGDADLILASFYGSEGFTLLVNGGAADFSVVPSGLAASEAGSSYLADFDGDGDLDTLLLFGLESQVFVNDGAGQFTLKSDAWPGDAPFAWGASAVDVDADGDVDLFLGGSSVEDQAKLFLNDGSASFVDGSANLPGTSSQRALGHADLDNDGDVDLLVGSDFAAASSFLNDGTGVFEVGPALEPFDAVQVALGDIDQDGDVDAIAADFERTIVQRNMTRQLARSGLTSVGKPFDMEIHGSPGSVHALWWSPGTFELTLPPYGNFFLDPLQFAFLGGGFLDAQGFASIEIDVPANPAYLGLTIYWQALIGDPLQFSNLVSTTITGY